MIFVSLVSEEYIKALEDRLTSAGLSFEKASGFKKIYKIDSEDKELVLSLNIEGLKNIAKDGDNTYQPDFVNQPITHNAGRYTLGGGWGLPRICRRKNPFRYQDDWGEGEAITTSYRYTRTGQGVDIYVLDVGFDDTVSDYAGRFTYQTPSVVGDKSLGSQHGVKVMGCAAGTVYGVAKNANLFYWQFPVFLASTQSIIDNLGSISDFHDTRVGTNRPAVLNCSYSGFGNEPLVNDAFAELIDKGVVCCLPTGNSRQDLDAIESTLAEADPDNIVVGATAIYDDCMFYEQVDDGVGGWTGGGTGYGSNVTLYAPGKFITSMGGGSTPIVSTGTSFATPYTAGVIACMLEGYQRLTSRAQVQAVKQKLMQNATPYMLRFPENTTIQQRGVDRLLYLDPYLSFEVISGLNPI